MWHIIIIGALDFLFKKILLYFLFPMVFRVIFALGCGLFKVVHFVPVLGLGSFRSDTIFPPFFGLGCFGFYFCSSIGFRVLQILFLFL